MTLIETLRSDHSNTTIARAARDAADEIEDLVSKLVRQEEILRKVRALVNAA